MFNDTFMSNYIKYTTINILLYDILHKICDANDKDLLSSFVYSKK